MQPVLVALIAVLLVLLVVVSALLYKASRREVLLMGMLLDAGSKSDERVEKHVDSMLETLSVHLGTTSKTATELVKSAYGVATPTADAQAAYDEASKADLISPWYAAEGAIDTSDPTDGYLVADPVEYTEQDGGLSGGLLLDGDDEPFGIPGVKVGD